METIPEVLRKYKTIAVVGLSRDSKKDSHIVASYFKAHGYKIIPVNPEAKEILGEKCYPNLAGIPGEIEVADVFRPSVEAYEIMEQAVKKGAKVVWLQLGIINEGAKEFGESAGLTVVMDRCMMVEHRRLMEERPKLFGRGSDPRTILLARLLTEKGIKFDYLDVSGKKNFEEMAKRSGQTGVPVLIVGEKIIVGYDREEIKKTLGIEEKK